jgi:nucleoside-diphosphate-sugar epimerase
MKVFVAGASGAIGLPLVSALVRQGHVVTGMTRSESGANSLLALGAKVAQVSAFDVAALERALREAEAEVVIDELTALPRDPAEYGAAFPGDRKLRLEGGGNLHRVAQACGVRRYIQQASGFFLRATAGLADESASLAVDASPGIAAGAQMYAEIESRLRNHSGTMEGVLLRYGFFYGPNTWYHPDGATGASVRRGEFPIIGQGEGVWSFVHVDDAAMATVAALTADPGTYNVVDDQPAPVSAWLPAFATWVGAPPPPRCTEQEALEGAGPDAVYFGTKLCGATNEKAKKSLDFRPRRPEWIQA